MAYTRWHTLDGISYLVWTIQKGVMLMGITNVPEIFMQIMDNLFLDMLDKGVVVCLDGILIFSNTAEERFKLLKKVFTLLY